MQTPTSIFYSSTICSSTFRVSLLKQEDHFCIFYTLQSLLASVSRNLSHHKFNPIHKKQVKSCQFIKLRVTTSVFLIQAASGLFF